MNIVLVSFKSLRTNLALHLGYGIASDLASGSELKAVSGIPLVFSYHNGANSATK